MAKGKLVSALIAIGLAGFLLTWGVVLPSLGSLSVSAESRLRGTGYRHLRFSPRLLAVTATPTCTTVAGETVTPTVTASATETATHGASYLPLVLKPPSHGVPPSLPYADDFSDPGSGWPVGANGNVIWGYRGGEYRIQITAASDGMPVTPDLVLPDSFRVEVDARQDSANIGFYGLIFGLHPVGSSYETYRVLVYPTTQLFELDKRASDGTWTTLIGWTRSTMINPGQARNHLRVDRIGTAIHIYVNGVLVGTLTDSSLTGPGRDAGVVAYSYDTAPVDIRFDNFNATAAVLVNPLFQDDFSVTGRWYTNEATGYRASYQDGEYEILARQPNRLYTVAAPLAGGLPDYAVEADMHLRLAGDKYVNYGLVFGVVDWDHYYVLALVPGKQWYSLWARTPAGLGNIITFTQSSLINQDLGTNRLKVERRGSQIRLFVNDRSLATTTDSTYLGNLAAGLYADWGALPNSLRVDNYRYSQLGATATGMQTPYAMGSGALGDQWEQARAPGNSMQSAGGVGDLFSVGTPDEGAQAARLAREMDLLLVPRR